MATGAVSSQSFADHHRPFGADRFGILAERFARFFGTPQFIVGQTVIIIVWIAVNAIVIALRWDAYPFILLNLVFSTQAAYAAPLILLAQTRQADRDHIRDEKAHQHAEQTAQRERELEEHQAQLLAQAQKMAEQHAVTLEQNTALTRQVAELTQELHDTLVRRPGAAGTPLAMQERESDTSETFGSQDPPGDVSGQNQEEPSTPGDQGASGGGGNRGGEGSAGAGSSERAGEGREGGAGEDSQATGHPSNAG